MVGAFDDADYDMSGAVFSDPWSDPIWAGSAWEPNVLSNAAESRASSRDGNPVMAGFGDDAPAQDPWEGPNWGGSAWEPHSYQTAAARDAGFSADGNPILVGAMVEHEVGKFKLKLPKIRIKKPKLAIGRKAVIRGSKQGKAVVKSSGTLAKWAADSRIPVGKHWAAAGEATGDGWMLHLPSENDRIEAALKARKIARNRNTFYRVEPSKGGWYLFYFTDDPAGVAVTIPDDDPDVSTAGYDDTVGLFKKLGRLFKRTPAKRARSIRRRIGRMLKRIRRLKARLEEMGYTYEGDDDLDEIGILPFLLGGGVLALLAPNKKKALRRAERQLRRKGRIKPKLLARIQRIYGRVSFKAKNARRPKKRQKMQRLAAQIKSLLDRAGEEASAPRGGRAITLFGPGKMIKRAERQLRRKGRIKPKLVGKLEKALDRIERKLQRVRRIKKKARLQTLARQIRGLLAKAQGKPRRPRRVAPPPAVRSSRPPTRMARRRRRMVRRRRRIPIGRGRPQVIRRTIIRERQPSYDPNLGQQAKTVAFLQAITAQHKAREAEARYGQSGYGSPQSYGSSQSFGAPSSYGPRLMGVQTGGYSDADPASHADTGAFQDNLGAVSRRAL